MASTFTTTADLSLADYKRLHAIVVSDTTASPGAAGLVNVRGGTVAGTVYLALNVAALGNSPLIFLEPLWIPEGIFLDVVSGTVRVTVQAAK